MDRGPRMKAKESAVLNPATSLKGFKIEASDGPLGTVNDLLVDDITWKIRWIVVGTGHFLTGRKVLIHPSAVLSTDYEARELSVSLSKVQVEASPRISFDQPVSRQIQNSLYGYYGWNPGYGGSTFSARISRGAMLGGAMGAIASPLSAPGYFDASAVQEAEPGEIDQDASDPHLRSIAEVTGYHVYASDGTIGHIEDFLVESEAWGVRYLVVDTSNWWVGQHVLISPYAVKEVDWSDRHIKLDLTRGRVRSSPSWNKADPIDGAFEQRLHSHYDWPGYGW
jgi:uncharacterized protein YrrD